MMEESKEINVEQSVIDVMKAGGIDTALTLPCDRMKKLLPLIPQNFKEVRLMREEGGVGIAAGLYMAGRKPAMVIQSTGIGNSLTVLSSLNKTYNIPLPILASWRGVYKEGIPAQVDFGKSLPGILDGAGIPYITVEEHSDLPAIRSAIFTAYEENTPYVVLISPKFWEGSSAKDIQQPVSPAERRLEIKCHDLVPAATTTRYDMIKGIVPYLRNRIVVSNIGVPSKELYAAIDQPTNFYMLGSWGLVTSIGIGLAEGKPDREVVVLEGDGSILFAPNGIGMAAQEQTSNLTIIAFDNSAHGSTGNQKTYSSEMDLGLLAAAYGIKNLTTAATPGDLLRALETAPACTGPRFIHVPVLAQNASVPDIPKPPVAIKKTFMEAITR